LRGRPNRLKHWHASSLTRNGSDELEGHRSNQYHINGTQYDNMNPNTPPPSSTPRMMRGGYSPPPQHSNQFGLLRNSEIEYMIPGAKTWQKEIGVKSIRILPSHNYGLNPSDQAFSTSVLPYRDLSAPPDPNTGHPAFTGWSCTAMFYTFLGRSKEFIMSRRMLRNFELPDADCSDPMIDMAIMCQNDDPKTPGSLHHYLERTGKPREDQVKWPGTQLVFSFCYERDQRLKVALTGISPAAYNHFLLPQLNQAALAQVPARHPAWPQYQYGDITDPGEFALCGVMDKRELASDKQSPWCFCFVHEAQINKPPIFPGATQPLDPGTLAQRPALLLMDTWNIPTYQQMLDWMVQDGAWPLELIKRACGNKGDLPVRDTPTYASSVQMPGLPAGPSVLGGAVQSSSVMPTYSPAVPMARGGFSPSPTPSGFGAPPPIPAASASSLAALEREARHDPIPTAQPLPTPAYAPPPTYAPPPAPKALNMGEQFYVDLPGQSSPVVKTRAEIMAMVLPPDTSVCVVGGSSWDDPAIHGFGPPPPPPPPPPATQVPSFPPPPPPRGASVVDAGPVIPTNQVDTSTAPLGEQELTRLRELALLMRTDPGKLQPHEYEEHADLAIRASHNNQSYA